MKKRLHSLVTIVVTVAALAAPVALSLYLAQRQAQEQEETRALEYAHDVVHRSEGMLGQVQAGIVRLQASRNACDGADIDAMRTIDLASSYIQAIGRVSGDTMVCSSLAGLGARGLPLGPADLASERGAKMRYDVRFPFSGANRFVVIEYKGIAAIIHKDLPLDASTTDKNVALALFWRENERVAAVRGAFRPGWMGRLGDREEVTFRDDGHVVAVVGSKKYLVGGVAALPAASVTYQARRLARVLLPLGVLAGLLLAALVLRVAQRQQAMPSIIRAGLRGDEFFLQYQPIIELATGRWVGAEALIRWRRPGGEMMRPDIFIQAAEDSGQILQITERVLALIARDAGELFRRHPDFHIAINLSAADLHSPQTIERLRALSLATGAGPGNLVVEATERGFLHEAVAKEMVLKLREEGYRVAVDDFGTGYSSLSYLQSLALDVLKIDKSFVDTIGAEAATSQVVVHIIEMAKDLRLEMVAEGVEHQAQADYLRERGVQFAQGWLFGRPMALPDLLAKMPRP
jgi:sensor c-di-GMP phosphodiesterase-like protein